MQTGRVVPALVLAIAGLTWFVEVREARALTAAQRCEKNAAKADRKSVV